MFYNLFNMDESLGLLWPFVILTSGILPLLLKLFCLHPKVAASDGVKVVLSEHTDVQVTD